MSVERVCCARVRYYPNTLKPLAELFLTSYSRFGIFISNPRSLDNNGCGVEGARALAASLASNTTLMRLRSGYFVDRN